MSLAHDDRLIAFVWSPAKICPDVVRMASRTGTLALVDLSRLTLDRARDVLHDLDRRDGSVHVLVSPGTLMESAFDAWLGENGIGGVWVELQPFLLSFEIPAVFRRMKELSRKRSCIPVLADVNLIMRVLDEYPDLGHIALKGCEASSFVSSESTLILYSTVLDRVRRMGLATNLLIWGAVGTAEAAVALLSTGARGVVFESLHWLTDLATEGDEFRHRIERLRPEDTELLGRDLGVPCRLFNKVNSSAVKEIKALAAALRMEGATEAQRKVFAEHVAERMILPAESRFGGDEVIPLGVEASFARSFATRYGSETEQAIRGFVADIADLRTKASDRKRSFLHGETSRQMGIRYPFVQGAMSWITDAVPFALTVADAGALPTLALGLMDEETLCQRLGTLKNAMEGRPYAVNVLALPENPFLDAQLEWIKNNRPPFVVIAAGSPSHVRRIVEYGSTPIYVAPNEDLLRLAFEAGARYVICEGNEAGGHLGSYTTFTFAQKVVELRHSEPNLFKDRGVILAGGIWNGDTVSMAALLGADAVQMGTAYLATAEIVHAGALTRLYQCMILDSPLGGTVVTGQAWGLPVRSLLSPKTKAIQDLESDLLGLKSKGNQDESSFRRQLELLTAGSLMIAARGIDRPGGNCLEEESCFEQGQFMSGACAGAIDRVKSLKDLHKELAEACVESPGFSQGEAADKMVGRDDAVPGVHTMQHFLPHFRRRDIRSGDGRDRIAITGMSIVNSLGSSPQEVWIASVGMKSGITLVPPSRWDHGLFYDPRPRTPERTYCKVGAFKDLVISRKELGIPPQDFHTMSLATRETLYLAQQAVEDSGILKSNIPRERIGVIVSQNAGEFAGTLEDMIIRASGKKIVECVKRVVPLTSEMEAAIQREVMAGHKEIDDTTLVGRLNAAAAGFICRKYGFMGPSYAVSAACASSLAALYSAVQMIRCGIIDAAVVGGGEENLTPVHFMEFSALGVLAGLSGTHRPPRESSRPFDADRDGTVLGEGGGMIVIERESAAAQRGASIQAYLTGMGASNNHLDLVEPSSVTQEIAIQSSFHAAAVYGPAEVDLVECHATATVEGDREEIKALKRIYGGQGLAFVTSFKSQIGHTLGASGINSLIRGVMAMKCGVFPPTLNCDNPDRELSGNDTGLMLSREPSDWKTQNDAPRRMQVNAFGFGGSNYVAQLEESREASDILLVQTEKVPHKFPSSVSPAEAWDRKASKNLDSGSRLETCRDKLGRNDAIGFSQSFKTHYEDQAWVQQEYGGWIEKLKGLFLGRTEIAGEPYRAALIAQTAEEAQGWLLEAVGKPETTPLTTRELRRLARRGIHLGPVKGPSPSLAFVFPGQGSQYPGMGKGLFELVPAIRQWLVCFAEQADFDLLDFLFSTPEEQLQNTRRLQPALFCLECALARYLLSLGLRPAAMAGHSLGEFSALCAAGVFSFEDGLRLVSKRAQCMERSRSLQKDAGAMLAVNAPLESVQEYLESRRDVFISNINTPSQVVLAGGSGPIRALAEEFRRRQFRSTFLNVSMAFHSPVMNVIRGELEAFLASIPFQSPRLPVISNATAKPFPSDPEEIKKLIIAQLEFPVQWADSVRHLWSEYNTGAFVEVGPGRVLTGLIEETLTGVECLSTCAATGEGTALRTAVARLYTYGCLDECVAIPADPPWEEKDRETRGWGDGGRGRRDNREIGRKDSKEMGSEAGNLQLSSHPVSPSPRLSLSPSLPVGELISIIMDVTGYERDEIHPDMDLREELSIRSSRLPVIMDAAEKKFGITIQFEDFIGVRTVHEMALQVSRLMASGPRGASTSSSASSEAQEVRSTPLEKEELKRVVFEEVSLGMGRRIPVELATGDTVAIFGAGRPTRLSRKLEEIFRLDYGLRTASFALMKKRTDWGAKSFDIKEEDEARAAAATLSAQPSLAGLVFIVDELLDKRIREPEDVSKLLRGSFVLLQAFLRSSARKFAFLVHRCEDARGLANVLAEGVLGMYLGAAPEYGAVQFRTLMLDAHTDPGYALRCALDRSRPVVGMIFRSGEAFTTGGRVAPLACSGDPGLLLSAGDVVILSGGGKGITSHLGRALIPFGPRMVLLGRTRLDSSVEHEALLKELRDSGVEAEYRSCDVVDGEQAEALVGDVVKRYGRVDGIIHGAGVIRDGLLVDMTTTDFSVVADVKLLGAWNLFKAAEKCGLRFFTLLSSAVAFQGNLGQVNYCAANRAAAALVRTFGCSNGQVRCMSLLVPPIAGAGMADESGIRQVMHLRGMDEAYIHVNELKELFCRELLIPVADHSVLFMRRLPEPSTARLDAADPHVNPAMLKVGAVEFERQDFPLIDAVSGSDPGDGSLEACRTFSMQKDLWIRDHRPFKSLHDPLLSAVMILEAFMEAARLLYPYLQVVGIQRAQFLDTIGCSPEDARFTVISCRRVHSEAGHVICEASLSAQDVSQSANHQGRMRLCHKARVILSGPEEHPWEPLAGFPISSSEFEMPPLDGDEVRQLYREKWDFGERYQVLSHVEGTGARVIRGGTIYTEGQDFSHLPVTRYQYSPYLLEAVFQLVACHMELRRESNGRAMIPSDLGVLMLGRKADQGEEILLEARMTRRDKSGALWDARCLDGDRRTLMQIRALRMHWMSG